jgi:beta-galactosidase
VSLEVKLFTLPKSSYKKWCKSSRFFFAKSLMPQLMAYYAPLFKRNITVDFAHPESDLSRYKLVIAPNLYLVTERAAENINRYVENGGNLVMSFFSGIVDENEHIHLGGYPAQFHETLGLVVEEFAPYSEAQSNSIRTVDGKQFKSTLWSDVIQLKGAESIVAAFEQDSYAGKPAITQNIFGKGTAFYVGTALDTSGMDWLIEYICKTSGIKAVGSNMPAGVELLKRTNGNASWLFILNHSGESVKVPLEQNGQDLLSGSQVNKSISLDPRYVAVIQLDTPK